MSEFIGSYENQVLDAIDIVVQAAIQSAGYDRTISATIMECIDSERGLYKVRYQDAIYTASAEDPSKKYAQNSQVYVLIPENDYSKHKRIIGTASELGEDYTAAITENPYKVLGGNCALMTKELSFSSYKGTDEYILYSSKGNITNSISIDKETFLSYIKDASKIKIGMDFKTFILKAQEGGVYGLQIIFTEKNIENQNEPLRKLVSLTNFDMIGHPYCSLDWGFQSIEFEINPERFIEIEEIKFFLQGFKEDKDKEEIPDIYIKDFFLAGLAHQDSTALNTYYLDIIAPANRTFTEGKDTLEMTADLSFRGETVVSTPPVEYYWFRENAAVKVESVPVDQKPLYHIYAGEGWECLNPYTFVTEEVEVNGVKETKITGGNWESLTTYSITSQNLKNVRYRCIAYFKDKVAGVKDIEITNNNPKYDLELISSDGNFNFYDNLGSKKLTLKLKKVVEENKNFEVEWGALDSSKLYSAIETIKVEDNQSSLTIYGRNINIEKRYFATLFEIEEGKKELIGTVSVNVTNEILSKESTYSVRIKNGEQVFIYDEGGYAPNHSSKTNPQVIIPLEFSLFDQDGKEIEVGEDFEIGVQWRLPQEGTLLTDIGSDNTALTYSFGIASIYSKNKTNNTIILEVLYKDKIYKDYTNFTFLKDGNSGTNGTGAFGKISFATDLNGEYPLLLQTSNNEFILNGNNINTNNSQLAVSIWNNGIETPSEKIKKITWRLNTVGEDTTKHQSYYTVDTGAVVLKGNDFTYLNNENIEKDHYIFSIVQAEVEYEDTASTRRKLFTEMPICLARSYQEGYSIRMKKGSGFNEVLYLNDGTSPQYASNPFEVEVLYNGTIFSDPKLSYKWRADGIKKNLIKLTNKNSNIESHLVDSLTRYDGLSLDLGITVVAYLDTQPIATLFFPINFLINRYGYASLNDWDGHSIQINKEDGYILTPQVGAGSKDGDNGFTGVLMGEVKTNPKTESGLFGYSKGQRTFFLDAESGRAEFGRTGEGQIIIDPDETGAYIRGGEYSTSKKSGMELNLGMNPHIKFGSGDFEVNSDGKIKSTAGSIGGWEITETRLVGAYKEKGKTTLYNSFNLYTTGSDTSVGWDNAICIGSKDKNSTVFTNSDGTENANFVVSHKGILNARGATVHGTINAYDGYIGNWEIKDGRIFHKADSKNYIYLDVNQGIVTSGDDGTVEHKSYYSKYMYNDSDSNMILSAGGIGIHSFLDNDGGYLSQDINFYHHKNNDVTLKLSITEYGVFFGGHDSTVTGLMFDSSEIFASGNFHASKRIYLENNFGLRGLKRESNPGDATINESNLIATVNSSNRVQIGSADNNEATEIRSPKEIFFKCGGATNDSITRTVSLFHTGPTTVTSDNKTEIYYRTFFAPTAQHTYTTSGDTTTYYSSYLGHPDKRWRALYTRNISSGSANSLYFHCGSTYPMQNISLEDTGKGRTLIFKYFEDEENDNQKCYFMPAANEITNLGGSSHRWYRVYAAIGNFSSSVTVNGTVVHSSDKRLKKDIKPLKNSSYIKMFDLLNPVSFKMKDSEKYNQKTRIGFIANEVKEALSKCNLKEDDFIGIDKDDEDYYTLAYEEFIALNTAKIKQLEQIILKQQEQIDKLIAKLG